MKKSILELELGLLVAYFGREAVIRELASITSTSLEHLESQVQEVNRRRQAKNSARKLPVDPVQEACHSHPENRDLLEVLGHGYNNRMFLSELRDVHNFLRHRGVTTKQKSRASGLKAVMRVLTTLPRAELHSLARSMTQEEKGSDFSLLANELMATPGL